MCDFKEGDEVEFIGHRHIKLERYHATPRAIGGLGEGKKYVVKSVKPFHTDGLFAVRLVGVSNGVGSDGFDSRVFRKVERKTDRMNLTEWLSQPSDYEEPKRPAKTKEKTK